MAKALEGPDVATEGRTVTGERTMAATEFRARCYGLMDEVAETGREIVITKRGKPVARLVPFWKEESGMQSTCCPTRTGCVV